MLWDALKSFFLWQLATCRIEGCIFSNLPWELAQSFMFGSRNCLFASCSKGNREGSPGGSHILLITWTRVSYKPEITLKSFSQPTKNLSSFSQGLDLGVISTWEAKEKQPKDFQGHWREKQLSHRQRDHFFSLSKHYFVRDGCWLLYLNCCESG